MVYNWIDIIQDYLLPPTCILCGNPGYNSRDICRSCCADLPRNNRCCYRCAEILETPLTSSYPAPPVQHPLDASSPAILCGRCVSRQPAFDVTYAPFIHQGAIRHLVHALKFNADYKHARLLGMLLSEHLKQNTERPDLILPVPLHKARYRQRGFNQSIEIGRTVAKELQIALDLNSCRRHRDTPHQTQLSAKKRRKNLKNAFAIVKPIHVRHIAILDDVMTTGTTAHELAYVLKKAGAVRVDVWVCARA